MESYCCVVLFFFLLTSQFLHKFWYASKQILAHKLSSILHLFKSFFFFCTKFLNKKLNLRPLNFNYVMVRYIPFSSSPSFFFLKKNDLLKKERIKQIEKNLFAKVLKFMYQIEGKKIQEIILQQHKTSQILMHFTFFFFNLFFGILVISWILNLGNPKGTV